MTTCLCCNGEAKHFANFRNKNRVVRRFRCLRCGKTFSEKQPLDDLRIDHDKVVQIVKLLTEGLGIRACARFVNCDPHTVLNVLETIGQKCEQLHDRLVRHVTTGSLQIDELWTRVGCSQKLATIQGDDFERGDQYTFLAVTAREKFIVSYHTGKRDLENTDIFVEDIAKRVDGRIQITTDSFRPYLQIVRKHLLERLDFATMQKLFDTPFDARAEAARRYSPAQCTGIAQNNQQRFWPCNFYCRQWKRGHEFYIHRLEARPQFVIRQRNVRLVSVRFLAFQDLLRAYFLLRASCDSEIFDKFGSPV
jgi:transposase-like protein